MSRLSHFVAATKLNHLKSPVLAVNEFNWVVVLRMEVREPEDFKPQIMALQELFLYEKIGTLRGLLLCKFIHENKETKSSSLVYSMIDLNNSHPMVLHVS